MPANNSCDAIEFSEYTLLSTFKYFETNILESIGGKANFIVSKLKNVFQNSNQFNGVGFKFDSKLTFYEPIVI